MSRMIEQRDRISPVLTMPMEQRLVRIDTLLCLLFEGLVNHPLATTMIPAEQLQAIQQILTTESNGDTPTA